MQGVKETRGVMSSSVLVKLSATMPIHLARHVPLTDLLRPYSHALSVFICVFFTKPLQLGMLLKMWRLFIARQPSSLFLVKKSLEEACQGTENIVPFTCFRRILT